jgi:hypothetical protein
LTRIPIEELVDYVRGLGEEGERQRIREASSDPQVARELEWLRELRELLERDEEASPSEDLTRAVLSLPLAAASPDSTNLPLLAADVTDEGWTEASLDEGIRLDGDRHRDLLVRGDSFELDLGLDHPSESADIYVVGHLALLDRPESAASGVPVVLVGYGRVIASTLTNSLGDFLLVADADEAVELCVLLKDRGQVRVPVLPDDVDPVSDYTH